MNPLIVICLLLLSVVSFALYLLQLDAELTTQTHHVREEDTEQRSGEWLSSKGSGRKEGREY